MSAQDYEWALPGQRDHGQGQIESWPGMTLRDYFAAAALPAIIAKIQSTEKPDFDELFVAHAMMAYAQADAMLEARK